MILKGQLSTKLLAANNTKEEERRARNNTPNKVVQKYREIYSNIARRQITEVEEDERRVFNILEKRLTEPHKKRYKALMKNFLMLYRQVRDKGKFI